MTKYIKTVPIEAEQFDGSPEMANKYDINLFNNLELVWYDDFGLNNLV